MDGPTLEQCRIHGAKLDQLCEDMKDVKLAVIGNEVLGVHGIVKDIAELKAWRRSIDLRVAAMGSIAGALVAGLMKWVFDK